MVGAMLVVDLAEYEDTFERSSRLTAAYHARDQELARAVFASLAEVPSIAIRLLAATLELCRPPTRLFAAPLECLADRLDDPAVTEGEPVLAHAKLTYSLRCAARDPACDGWLARLGEADAPLWPAIRAALVDVRARRPMPPMPAVHKINSAVRVSGPLPAIDF